MNHRVPDFHLMEDEYQIPTSSGYSRPTKSATGEEDIMELMWDNGQVLVQRSSKKHSPYVGGGEAVIQSEQPMVREFRQSGDEQQQQLFMQEDEMASWLQYPMDDSSFDRDLYADLLYSAPPPQSPITTIAPPRPAVGIRAPSVPPRPPPIPPSDHKPETFQRLQNFGHFSRFPNRPRIESTAIEATVVESSETPAAGPDSRVSQTMADRMSTVYTESATAAGADTLTGGGVGGLGTGGTCDCTVTSSPGGSSQSFSASADMRPPLQKTAPAAAEDRKRKVREPDDNECRSEDVEFGAAGAKKQVRGSSSSTKRSRAAEVHNLSERRRRDRINEKMRALQELIPRCNKSDKASMLDEAIEYLKSLQLQVQMMSMGCGMIPMMYPGMQQYMPAMGMGMGMGMNRPMVPYPTMLPGSSIPNAATATHMGPRFPVPAFHMPSVPVPDPSTLQASNQRDPMLNTLAAHNSNHSRMPSFVDLYQQFLSQFPGLPIQQNQAVLQPNSTGPGTSKEVGSSANQQQIG